MATKLITSRIGPRGPMQGGLPAFGGRIRPARLPDVTSRIMGDRASKKGYTGTRAGVGRPVSRALGRGGSGGLPAGPRAHSFNSVQLPKREPGSHRNVEFHPAQTRPPSLMTRIRDRLTRSAAAFGF